MRIYSILRLAAAQAIKNRKNLILKGTRSLVSCARIRALPASTVKTYRHCGAVRVHPTRVIPAVARRWQSEAAQNNEQAKASSTAELSKENPVGERERHSFQSDTQKLLSIVASSLYTDKEVFVRELVSNASDALEKVRTLQLTGAEVDDKYLEPEIHITTNEEAQQLTIQDFGIGMTKEELMKNLGTIAHSGTSEFLARLEKEGKDVLKSGFIGQFGVGFYSVFMVAKSVTVFSRSAQPGSKGYMWRSDGSGAYELSEAEGVTRGTKIVIDLKDECMQFTSKQELEAIIRKYSNFVGFPIKINGERVNTVRALWTLPKNQITDDEHKEFYRFISRGYDDPVFRLHFHSDTPIHIQALFYFPRTHMEKYGMGRMEPGVSLFSKKVLIQAKAKGLLPEWLRFVKGVVDSHDIPLHVSREHLQDSALINRLGNILSQRILKFLHEEAKHSPKKYEEWFAEFGNFLKEGICTDFKFKEDLGKLLRYESSAVASPGLVSFDDYIGRMPAAQKNIYYLVVPNRELAEASPYLEAFKTRKIEVLFLYNAIDDFVMTNLSSYSGKPLKSAESADIEQLPSAEKTDTATTSDATANAADATRKLSAKEVEDLLAWLKDALIDKVAVVKQSERLVSSPAIIVDHESATMRRMMRFVDPQRAPGATKHHMEVNVNHPVILKLNLVRNTAPDVARTIAEQLLDNAMITAGLMDDSRAMVPRLNKILEQALSANLPAQASGSQ